MQVQIPKLFCWGAYGKPTKKLVFAGHPEFYSSLSRQAPVFHRLELYAAKTDSGHSKYSSQTFREYRYFVFHTATEEYGRVEGLVNFEKFCLPKMFKH